MGGAARAADVVVPAWRARPASQRKRRLKRRDSGFMLARRLKATVTDLPRSRGLAGAAGTTLTAMFGVSGAPAPRVLFLGISRASKGGVAPLDEHGVARGGLEPRRRPGPAGTERQRPGRRTGPQGLAHRMRTRAGRTPQHPRGARCRHDASSPDRMVAFSGALAPHVLFLEISRAAKLY